MSTDTNPYQPSNAVVIGSDDKSTTSPNRQLLWALAYLFPIHVLIAFYGTWLVAWATLGHMPRPSLDDPRSIGVLVSVAYLLSAGLLTAMPILTPLGLFASFFLPSKLRGNRRRAARLVLVVIYIAACFVVLQILQADPGQVVEWFFD